MAFNELIVNGYAESSPTLIGVGIGSSAAGSIMQMGRAKTGTLSSTVVLVAGTAMITLTPIWEVSIDGATWHLATVANNALYVTQAVAGDSNTHILSAPDACYGNRFSRVSVMVAGAAGLAADTCTISYNYIADDMV